MKIEILCNVRRQNGSPGAFLAILFVNTFGAEQVYLLPKKLLLSPKNLKEWLIDRHFDLPSEDEWNEIVDQLKEGADKIGEIVDRTGFIGDSYLLPDGSVIGDQAPHSIFLNHEKKISLPQCDSSGSLDDWKSNVAPAALYSSRIMLAICGALSGYLLKLTRLESGGFHMFGMSSIGKTTGLKVAISISGPRSNMQTWNFTESGAAELAFGHNDSFLAFDELKTIDSDPKEAAKKTTALIYKLCSGIEKKRSANYKSDQDSWNVGFLSTGEDSLSKHAAHNANKRLMGEVVRVIDVPADAGKGLGIFESIPKEFDNPSQYVSHLGEQSSQLFGSVQPVFLKELIDDINDEGAEKPVKDRIEAWMNTFKKKHEVDQESGADVRFANRFALACAAGCLAVEYGVLPFTRSQVYQGISRCYEAALELKPKTLRDNCREFNSMVYNYLKSNSFPELRSRKHWSSEQIEEVAGFKLSISKIPFFAIKREKLKAQKMISRMDIDQVLNEFILKGYLLPDAGGSITRQLTNKGQKIGRFLCFVRPRSKENIAAVKELKNSYSKIKNRK